VYIDEKAGDVKRAQDRIKRVNIQLLNFMSKGERGMFLGNLLSLANAHAGTCLDLPNAKPTTLTHYFTEP